MRRRTNMTKYFSTIYSIMPTIRIIIYVIIKFNVFL